MSKIKKLWLNVWQMPQTIVGLIVLAVNFERCKLFHITEEGAELYRVDGLKKYRSYGYIFFVNKHWNVKHILKAYEREKNLSRILGWFYLPWLGIKSLYNKIKK